MKDRKRGNLLRLPNFGQFDMYSDGTVFGDGLNMVDIVRQICTSV